MLWTRPVRGSAGDMLVFLPGEREIREAADHLRKHHRAHAEVLPLFARLSAQEQEPRFSQPQAARGASCSPPTSPRPR